MSQIKLFAVAAFFSVMLVGTADANPWGRYNRGFYGPPVYAYPPVVVAPPLPPPVVVRPRVYVAPSPVYVAPVAPIYGPPVYGPPVYGYGVVGPRGRVRMSYATPGYGVYLGQ